MTLLPHLIKQRVLAKSIWSHFHLSLVAIFSFYPSSQIDANIKQGIFIGVIFLMKKINIGIGMYIVES